MVFHLIGVSLMIYLFFLKRINSFGPLLIKTGSGYLPIHHSFLTWSQGKSFDYSKLPLESVRGSLAENVRFL